MVLALTVLSRRTLQSGLPVSSSMACAWHASIAAAAVRVSLSPCDLSMSVSSSGWVVASDRLRQRDQRVAHDPRVFFLVAAGDLDLAQARGVLHHHAAALPTAVLESGQRGLEFLVPREFFGQHDRVLDADAGTRGEMGRGGVHGIADQHDTAAEPG